MWANRHSIFALIALTGVAVGVAILIAAGQNLSFAQDGLPAAGTEILDEFGVAMVFVPNGTIELGIDHQEARAACEQFEPDSNTEDCVAAITESSGATYTQVVELQPFWIDKYEITIAIFNDLCLVYGDEGPEPCPTDSVPEHLRRSENQPISGVSWYSAMSVCGSRNARLPTEAEWEYAAAGPEEHSFPWGDNFCEGCTNVVLDSGEVSTYPVGTKDANVSWIGAYDLSGNVSEWVEDRYIPRILSNLDPSEWPSPNFRNELELSRLIKGGSWVSAPGLVTTWIREHRLPSEATQYVGFRCARSLIN